MKFMYLPVGPGSDIWVDWGDGSDPVNYVVTSNESAFAAILMNLVDSMDVYDDVGTIPTDEEFKDMHAIGDMPLYVYPDEFDLDSVDIKMWGTVSYWISSPITLKTTKHLNTFGPEDELIDVTTFCSTLKGIKQWGDLVTDDFSSRVVNDDQGRLEAGIGLAMDQLPLRSNVFTGAPSDLAISATDAPKFNTITNMDFFFPLNVQSMRIPVNGDVGFDKFNMDFSAWSNLDFSGVNSYLEMISSSFIFSLYISLDPVNILADDFDMSPIQMTHINVVGDDGYPEDMFPWTPNDEPVGFIPPTFSVYTLQDELVMNPVNTIISSMAL